MLVPQYSIGEIIPICSTNWKQAANHIYQYEYIRLRFSSILFMNKYFFRIGKILRLQWNTFLDLLNKSQEAQRYFEMIQMQKFIKSSNSILNDNSYLNQSKSSKNPIDLILDFPAISHIMNLLLEINHNDDKMIMLNRLQQLIDKEIVFREMHKNKPMVTFGILWFLTSSALQHYRVSLC